MLAAFRLDAADNVATLLGDAPPGPVACLGAGGDHPALAALEPISHGHKIALANLNTGDAIVKFGVRIGHATQPIALGAWVHLHNLASDFDTRSGTLDLHSGTPTDTTSEYA